MGRWSAAGSFPSFCELSPQRSYHIVAWEEARRPRLQVTCRGSDANPLGQEDNNWRVRNLYFENPTIITQLVYSVMTSFVLFHNLQHGMLLFKFFFLIFGGRSYFSCQSISAVLKRNRESG